MVKSTRRRRAWRRLLGETCEPRYCLSAVAFATHEIYTTPESSTIQSVYAADLDHDDDLDVLSASLIRGNVAWYENIDGSGSFGTQRIIAASTELASFSSVYAADLDGDDDLDVLTSSWTSEIAWFENLDGLGSFGAQQTITSSAGSAMSVHASDLDSDGDLDVLAVSTEGLIAWYENMNGLGSFGPQQLINADEGRVDWVRAADLDGDGDPDVLTAEHDRIAWYENLDGQGAFGAPQVISTAVDGGKSVSAADLDGDGDLDVVSASTTDDKIAWYENLDGQGSFGPQRVISMSADGAQSVDVGDVDGDGDLDVLSASSSDDKIAWYENLDGQGSFGPQQVITAAADMATSVYGCDLDRDGDLDVLSGTISDGGMLAWHENLSPSISIDDVQLLEQDAGILHAVFPVRLSGPSSQTVAVTYTTADVTAVAGSDYLARTGQLEFPIGSTSATIEVPVVGDLSVEGLETFQVILSHPVHASLVDDTAAGTILDNDTTASRAYARAEKTTLGSRSGTYRNTTTSDNVYESLTEVRQKVKSKYYSALEHRWEFDVISSGRVMFLVEAHHTANSEGDDFRLEYSTDGANYLFIQTITKQADNNMLEWTVLPDSPIGKVYVRVVDTDRTAGQTSLDTLFVDQMYFEWAPAPRTAESLMPDELTDSAVAVSAMQLVVTPMTTVSGVTQNRPVQTTDEDKSTSRIQQHRAMQNAEPLLDRLFQMDRRLASPTETQTARPRQLANLVDVALEHWDRESRLLLL